MAFSALHMSVHPVLIRILQVRAVGVMEGPMLSPLVTDSPINKQQVMPLLDIGALLHDEP